MQLIVGLGNPGKLYTKTRHNVGFMVLDAVREKYGLPVWSKKFKGEMSAGKIGDEQVVLLKPHTYMNVSGESVLPAAQFYKVKPVQVMVVHDDIDLKFLELKHKIGGGDAGHNGLKSITQALGSDYRRLRIGVGRSDVMDVADYVLQNFAKAEAGPVADLCERLAEHMDTVLADPAKALALLKSSV